MARLDNLKNAQSLSDLAKLLGFTPKGLSYTLYKVPDDQKYTKFQVPKKNGGARNISAPKGQLKLLQRRLADLLYDCRDDLNRKFPRRPISHGFRRSQSIITNAYPHRHRRYVLNVDLKDYFPAFNFGRVRGFFIENRDFTLNDKVATLIAQIACFENSLPQGSPCSPVIADMISHILDVRLVNLAKTAGATYSRYADDLTFSSNIKKFSTDLAFRDVAPGSDWIVGYALSSVVRKYGFGLTEKKTRMQCSTGRQMVTGLTVNTKVNIPAYYLRSARAMCNSLFQIGTYHLPSEDGMLESLKPLEGMLSHIYRVKRSAVLARRPPKSKDPMKVPSEELYRRFLFYKYFVGLDRPLIVREGKTDNIYLKYAIRDRVALWPQLGEVDGASVRIKVNFFNYKSTVQNILDLTGESSKIHKFLNQFGDHLSRYAHRPLGHPVIVIIDNDDGLTAQLRTDLKKHFDIDISLLSTQPFYRLANNLYVIKTPEAGVSGISCIEDCFDPSTRSIRLDGKAFNPAKKIDVATEYGKAPFAEKVVIPNAKQISWDGFDPLLARIDAVISDYRPPALTVVARAA